MYRDKFSTNHLNLNTIENKRKEKRRAHLGRFFIFLIQRKIKMKSQIAVEKRVESKGRTPRK